MAQGRDDVLNGAGGTNILIGVALSDVFVFRALENGQHVVVDPEPWDVLRFEGFGYGSEQDVASHLSAEGRDVVFADQGVTVTFPVARLSDISNIEYEF